MHLTVLIPVYNEQRTLAESVRRLLATPLPPGIERRTAVLVDDGSSDATPSEIASLKRDAAIAPHLHTVRHEVNRGKGAAVRTALTAGIELAGDLFLVHDADLEYDPADHARVLAPVIDGRADAVIGSRFLGDTHRVLYFWHSVANKGITALSNIFTNLNLTDIECCSKAFTRAVALQLKLEEDRFGIEPELVAKLASAQLPVPPIAGSADSGAPTATGPVATRAIRIYEVAVSYAGRTYAEGKKITWQDGLAAVACIIKYNTFQ
ncbi:MAG TPA: glycosyltransferase family 2 protein [Phycisphaerales bacterium]|nr:glycosyltransferase family 2 protein [Phycisphaerales bacterium]